MLKVGIVGCGKIADSHAEQLQRIPGCEIAGVCDREPLMARQLFERFPVGGYFGDLGELLESARPDVVHITTSPESHFDLARRCLEAGCHVYVEKPFALNETDTRKLIDLAELRGLKVTAGHDDQFSHVSRRMRELIRQGYLGGRPVHMESYYCYELGQSAYAAALLGDKSHWVRRLPGKLLQNIISHGIARIAEHLTTDSPEVVAHGYISPCLKEMGETEIVDELRVIISECDRTTAYFTFSSQMRPPLHQFRIYGPQNGLILDQDQETLIKLRGKKAKSYLEKFATPLGFAKQYCSNVSANMRTFLARDFHMKAGMKYLIEQFYRSIENDEPLPIPYREIILSARIMDSIFAQVAKESREAVAL
ncbi:MAG: Gfo/Idh/MocA family protein [Terracidiphilus sp.]